MARKERSEDHLHQVLLTKPAEVVQEAEMVQWESHLTHVLSTKPAEVVQEACQVLENHGCHVKELKSELYVL